MGPDYFAKNVLIRPDGEGGTLDADKATAELSGPVVQQHMDLGRAYSVTQHRQPAKVHFPKYLMH